MNLRKFGGAVVALGLVFGAAEARAQFGVYGVYQGTRLGGIQCLNTVSNGVGTAAPCANGTPGYAASASPSTGSLNFTGGYGGVFYDWRTFGPARIGFDVRAGEEHSNKSASSGAGGSNATSTQAVLAGVRASFHTPISVLKPYGQVSAGWARSNVSEPFGTTVATSSSLTPPRSYDNFLRVEGFVGADIRILPQLDLRAVELGIGNMNRMGSGNAGSSSVSVQSVGIGIVFHLPAS